MRQRQKAWEQDAWGTHGGRYGEMLLMWGERPEDLVEQVVLSDGRELLRAVGEHLRDDTGDVLDGVDLGRLHLARAVEGVETVVRVREVELVVVEVGVDGVHDAGHVEKRDPVGGNDDDHESQHPCQSRRAAFRPIPCWRLLFGCCAGCKWKWK